MTNDAGTRGSDISAATIPSPRNPQILTFYMKLIGIDIPTSWGWTFMTDDAGTRDTDRSMGTIMDPSFLT